MKPIIYNLYMQQGKPNLQVSEDLRNLYNFDVSARQLKSKFSAWRWAKKLNDIRVFFAMEKVIRECGSGVWFEVTLTQDEPPKKKTAACVIKETKRKKSTFEKKGQPIPQIATLDEALQILRESGTQIGGIVFPTHPYFHSLSIPPQTQQPGHVSNPAIDHGTGNVSDDASTTSAESLSDYEGENSEMRDINTQESARLWNVSHASHVAGTGISPRPNAWAYELSRDIPPQNRTTQILSGEWPSITIRGGAESPVLTHTNTSFDDVTDMLTKMSHSLHPQDAQRNVLEKFLGMKLAEHYRHFDLGQTQRPLIEFAAYYILQCLAGYKTLDAHDHPHRVGARQKLSAMLQMGNPHLLSTIYWIVTVMGSNDVRQQLQEFFEDCSECIEQNPCPESSVIRPYVMIGLSIFKQAAGSQALESEASSRLVEELLQKSKLKSELEETLDYLRKTGQNKTAKFVIVQGTYAWYFEKVGQHDQCLHVLLSPDGLELAEKIMGTYHLVTSTYMAMISRCYEQRGDTNLATYPLKTAMVRLQYCAFPLRAYLYRLHQQLAKLLLKSGEFKEAVDVLKVVFDFRLERLGPTSGSTWETAYLLFDALEGQGNVAEAKQRRDDLTANYRRAMSG